MEYTETRTYKLTPFGVKLKKAGITYYALGKACGVPQARIASWAKGAAVPTVGRDLVAVIEYLDWHGTNVDIAADFGRLMEKKQKRKSALKRIKKIPVPRRKDWKGGEI